MPALTPPGYARIKVVKSFDELVTTPFDGGVNALCWERALAGDFSELVERLGVSEGMTTLDDSRLAALRLSAAGRAAVDILLEDQRLLRERGLDPVLYCIRGYPRDEEPEVVRTDVYSFHTDSAPVEADTWLCTYTGATSEGLRNDEALRRVDRHPRDAPSDGGSVELLAKTRPIAWVRHVATSAGLPIP